MDCYTISVVILLQLQISKILDQFTRVWLQNDPNRFEKHHSIYPNKCIFNSPDP